MLQIFSIIALLAFAVFTVSVFIGVPCLPTHKKQARLMVELADLKPGMTAIDLGSGYGRILWLAANTGAKVVGYELNPVLYLWTRALIKIKKLDRQVEVKFQSIYSADLSKTDAVFCFLLPKPMIRLQSKFLGELKPGATVLSYAFSMPRFQPAEKREGIFVYKF